MAKYSFPDALQSIGSMDSTMFPSESFARIRGDGPSKAPAEPHNHKISRVATNCDTHANTCTWLNTHFPTHSSRSVLWLNTRKLAEADPYTRKPHHQTVVDVGEDKLAVCRCASDKRPIPWSHTARLSIGDVFAFDQKTSRSEVDGPTHFLF